jgi:HAD superfamily hydrolase (TIGR01509 family)
MRPFDAILFDLGGTLDGRHGWRDRFHHLLPSAGIPCSRDQRAAAFDYAESRSRTERAMATSELRRMVTCHVGWQLEFLGRHPAGAVAQIVDSFISDIYQAAAANRAVLAELARCGFKLGVVSNGCGNTAGLCEEYGYATTLAVMVDSHQFGAAKPDPSIFRHAMALIGSTPERTAFVGDSLHRDIAPAKALGMHTFWIAGRDARLAPRVDAILDTVAELPAELDRWSA